MGAGSGGAGSGFPIDLVLFGMIAAFLVLRLRSILGRRTGYERPELRPQPGPDLRGPTMQDGRVIDGRAEPVTERAARKLPDPASPLGHTLARMQSVDRGFDPARFLDGAEAAFRMIVTAFAAGDRATLRPLLSEDTWRAFDAAIATREAAGERQRSDIQQVREVTIESADLRGSVADIGVRFVSDQISLTTKDGQPVSGTDAVTEITDLWMFERDLAAADPTWRLVSARSA
ncbi:MAG: Tim44 domain-containing protein [Acidisphaera sp.]|nr:Tim44 domain-containing protein [Acidisphaera sp.]